MKRASLPGSQVIREAQLFELYSRYVWPVHRRFAKRYLSPRCKKCTLSSHHVSLSAEGLCRLCERPESILRPRKPGNLDHLLQQYSGKGKKDYDAIVLFSGGKDSVYLLHRVHQEHPRLRILAVTVDNTFLSPVAESNIRWTLQKTKVPHLMVRLDPTVVEKTFRYAITHLNAKGTAGTVDQCDGELFMDVARNLAHDLSIPLILCGLSPTQVETLLGNFHFELPAEPEGKDRTHIAGISVKKIPELEKSPYLWRGSQKVAARRPRILFPFYVWQLEESYIKQEVLRLGLVKEGAQSPLLTNHQLIPLMGIVDVVRFGASSFEPEFARMVREGKAQRSDWLAVFELLEYAAKTGHFISNSVDIVLQRLKLTRQDLGVPPKRGWHGAR